MKYRNVSDIAPEEIGAYIKEAILTRPRLLVSSLEVPSDQAIKKRRKLTITSILNTGSLRPLEKDVIRRPHMGSIEYAIIETEINNDNLGLAVIEALEEHSQDRNGRLFNSHTFYNTLKKMIYQHAKQKE